MEPFRDSMVLSVAAAAALFSAFLTPVVAGQARRLGIVDRPDPRKHHRTPTALLGGLPVLAGALIATLGAIRLSFDGSPELLSGTEVVWLAGCSVGAALLTLIGLWDDISPLPVLVKMAVQIAAAAICVILVRPLAETVGPVTGAVIGLVWLVLVTNSFNLIDNMDGAAPGVGAVAAGFCAYLTRGEPFGLACAALLGAMIGFLLHNRHPARVFLGDGGSLPVGFLLGAAGLRIADDSAGYWPVVLLVFGVPLLDTTLVVISRFRRGLNPLTTPGKDHLSHRLVALGFSVSTAVTSLWALGLVFGLAGLAVRPPPLVAAPIILVSGAAIWGGLIALMERWVPSGLTDVGKLDHPSPGDRA